MRATTPAAPLAAAAFAALLCAAPAAAQTPDAADEALKKGDVAEARALLEQSVKRNPADYGAALSYASTLPPKEALKAADSISRAQNAPGWAKAAALRIVGDHSLLKEEYKKAADAYLQASKLDGASAYRLLYALSIAMDGQTEAARGIWGEIALDKADKQSEEAARMLALLPKPPTPAAAGGVNQSNSTNVPTAGGVNQPNNTNVPTAGVVSQSNNTNVPTAGGVNQPNNTNVPTAGGVNQPNNTNVPTAGVVNQPNNTNVPTATVVNQSNNTNVPTAGVVNQSNNKNAPTAGGVNQSNNTNVPTAGGVNQPNNTNAPTAGAVNQSNNKNAPTAAAVNQSNNKNAPAAAAFTIQVGAFASKENADNLVKRLAGKYDDISVTAAASGGQTLYRVRVGSFQKKEDAVEFADKLIIEAGLSARVTEK